MDFTVVNKEKCALTFGSPAAILAPFQAFRPVALRPQLSLGLPLSDTFML